MDDTISFALEGRKTFFIATEQSLLPESYLEDYLTRGYETYIISDDRNCPLVKKVESIISIFEDSILFFYIDAEIERLKGAWAKLDHSNDLRCYAEFELIEVTKTK